MVVDYKVVNRSRGGDLQDGTFMVLEQLPGKIIIHDQTQVLRTKGYWASYNRAFYSEIFDESGARKMANEYPGDWFTHANTARAKIFRRDQHKVKDIPSLTRLMRYNDYKNDEFGVVEGCVPERTPAGAIANRLDLSDPKSNCTFASHDWMVGHWG